MDLQTLIAILITLCAVVYLVRLSVSSLRTGGGGCGTGCSKCPENVADENQETLPVRKQLYSIGDSKPNQT